MQNQNSTAAAKEPGAMADVMAGVLSALLMDGDCDAGAAFGATVVDSESYESSGLLTRDAGLVVRLDDGREFQITVVQSRGARR